MPYKLIRLAPGSYDVVLDGVIVASLVRSGPTSNATWTVELLDDIAPKGRPKPFKKIEHSFRTLEDVQTWLGVGETCNSDKSGHSSRK